MSSLNIYLANQPRTPSVAKSVRNQNLESFRGGSPGGYHNVLQIQKQKIEPRQELQNHGTENLVMIHEWNEEHKLMAHSPREYQQQ
jgi:hypothetical protein